MEGFAERLKTLRTNVNKKQDDVARVLNISRSTIGMYERGERSPSKDTLNELARYFNVSVDYLLGNTEYPAPIDENSMKIKDLDAFLEQSSVMFKGKMLSDEEKKRIQDILTALFWEVNNNG